jgi:hypothetical protein
LCTCIVYFAVKKNVLDIKRENFEHPLREDDYGTSVLSIQFTRDNPSYISIKSRYNHAVAYSDSTFHNNLENIIPGLTTAFAEKENLTFEKNFSNKYFFIDYMVERGYIFDKNMKMYKRTSKIFDGYTCLNNNILKFDANTIYFDKSRYIMVENYLIDQKSKKIIDVSNIPYIIPTNLEQYFEEKTSSKSENLKDGHSEQLLLFDTSKFESTEQNEEENTYNDTFTKSIGELVNINICYDENKNKIIELVPVNGEKIKITVNKNGHMVKYYDPNITIVDNNFLAENVYLKEIDLPNAKKIGNKFLYKNKEIKSVNLPKCESVGNSFLPQNNSLLSINLQNLKQAGFDFLYNNNKISNIELPNLQVVGDDFVPVCEKIKKINFPKLKVIGNNFMSKCKNISSVSLPNAEIICDNFLSDNELLTSISLPNAKTIGKRFLYQNKILDNVNLPNANEIKSEFLYCNNRLEKIDLPKVKNIGNLCFCLNESVHTFNMPNIENIGKGFMYNNKNRETILKNANLSLATPFVDNQSFTSEK